MLPVPFDLYKEDIMGKVVQIRSIGANQRIRFAPSMFHDGDSLITVIQAGALPGIDKLPFLEPITLNSSIKSIRLGAVTYDNANSSGQYLDHSTHWDMPGVWIVNKMRVPINIFYKGNLVAQLYADDGMNYLGGSASSLWFSNDREGLDFGDELKFSFAIPGWERKYLFTVPIDDNFAQTIYVGSVAAGMVGPPPDTYAYSVDQPVWTGITYYLPIGRGNTRATNPLAPF